MFKQFCVSASAVLLAGLMLTTAYAEPPHGGPSGGHGGPSVGSHGGPSGSPHGGPSGGAGFPHGGPSGSFHGTFTGGGMPPHGFHETPPGFHGPFPHGAVSPSFAHHGPMGPGGHFGSFHGHDFGHFSPGERAAWEHGSWRHTWHNGHYGWWWFADGLWFFYTAPIYPYPLYVGSDYYYDYYDENGAPPYYWYYCEDPPGYYPYVRQCNGPWEPVPPNTP